MDRVDRFPSTAKFSDIAGIDQVATPACHVLCNGFFQRSV